MGFDFIHTIMFFGIGLETEKVINVVEEKSVRMFDVTITKDDCQMSYEVICYDNKVQDIRDSQGDYIQYWSDLDDSDECSDEWSEIENIVKEHLK
jgi:hypothetical protein